MNEEEFVSIEALELLDAIFDKKRKIETDSDLLELANLLEDESDENEVIRDRGKSNDGF